MSHPTIQLTPRASKGTREAVELRSKGLVPCIVYGHNKTRQPEMFALEERA
ncbi:MAG: 50S ribosomal protein L25, partial [Planctomycetota bacterium]